MASLGAHFLVVNGIIVLMFISLSLSYLHVESRGLGTAGRAQVEVHSIKGLDGVSGCHFMLLD